MKTEVYQKQRTCKTIVNPRKIGQEKIRIRKIRRIRRIRKITVIRVGIIIEESELQIKVSTPIHF